MKLKTIISIALVLIICVTVIPASSSAKTSGGVIYPFIPDVKTYYSEAEEYIASQLRQQKTQIDISSYQVPTKDIIYIYRAVMFDYPDIFYVNSAYIPYQYDRATDTVAILRPQYIFDINKIPSYIGKFNKAAKKLISGIDSSYSDFQKAIVLHDRIAVNCKYKEEDLKSFTAYNVIVSGKGICEGYCRAYSYLLSLVGVDSKCLNNESKQHCWSLVKLGGNWYHVDVTSDDPMPDAPGYVRHKFFLISDSKLASYNSKYHSGYKSDITYSQDYTCSSSKYNSSFFRNIISQTAVYNGKIYYISNKYKNKYSVFICKSGSSTKKIKVIKDVWKYSNGKKVGKSYCNLCESNGKYLFFNSKRSLYRYDLKAGKIKRVLKLPEKKSKNFVGVKFSGSYLYANRKNNNLTKTKLQKMIKFSGNKYTVLPILKYTSKTLKKGKSFKLKVYYGSGKTQYKSSNKKIAKVSSKGKVKALKKGKCTITAVKNGKKLKCKIKVK